tara:strand:- start:445 stop:678 length:234 start_codon:yes stop_codon:yes gene_type:complete
MQLRNVKDNKELQADLMNGEIMPDFKRLYICDRLLVEKDKTQLQLLEALLDGYDRGKIDVRFDFWDGEVKFAALDIN